MKYVPLRPGAELRICERMRLEPDIERRVSGAKQVTMGHPLDSRSLREP
jgi:hypothetical protein